MSEAVVTPSATLIDAIAQALSPDHWITNGCGTCASPDEDSQLACVMAVLAEHDVPRACAVLAAVDGTRIGDRVYITVNGSRDEAVTAIGLLAALRAIKGTTP